jgi:hypothetical protein
MRQERAVPRCRRRRSLRCARPPRAPPRKCGSRYSGNGRVDEYISTRPNRLLGALHPCCPAQHGVWRRAAARNAGLAH